jgi:Na+/proline symporter
MGNLKKNWPIITLIAAILVGMAAPYLIGMYWKKANHAGAVASFFSGVISWVILTFYFMNSYVLPVMYEGEMMDDVVWDSIYIASAPAFFISVIFFFAISLLTQKQDPPKILTDINGDLVDTKNIFAWSPSPEETQPGVAD